MDETIKKIARTAANQFNLLDQYPEYRFIQSAAYHTWLMEQHYPQVFRQLQKRVADGRFELNGAVWVECDCNIPSGESLVRQFLWGTRYIRDKFGKEQRVFWLPGYLWLQRRPATDYAGFWCDRIFDHQARLERYQPLPL